ncbi:MAG: DUF2007 domain-containing protein [Bacteroidetes bacterium]|nr:MAG: DUF2007 domain-containing protein [Bacteroidota bacterium]
MPVNWVKVYETHDWLDAQIKAALLKDNGIKVNVLNKTDSTYHFMSIQSLVELYVPDNQVIKAKHVIQHN